MNYYPTNFYSNYPYQNGYNQPQLQPPQQPQLTAPAAQPTVPGKIVDSMDVARVADVPFGGYGVFPKADLSEVYIKIWNSNGTTSMATYKPIVEGKVIKTYTENEDDSGITKDEYQEMMQKIKQLEEKISSLVNTNTKNSNKKELSANVY